MAEPGREGEAPAEPLPPLDVTHEDDWSGATCPGPAGLTFSIFTEFHESASAAKSAVQYEPMTDRRDAENAEMLTQTVVPQLS
jgi:hypothetical protein